MSDKNYTLAMKIRNIILSTFPSLDINVYFDNELKEYIISTRNKEYYYSENYGKLISEINNNILWCQGIFNFYFILDEGEKEFDMLTNVMSFSFNNEILFKPWARDTSNLLLIEKHNNTDNYSLAA